jgi:lysophospholipase L1-like esterase
MIGSIDTYGYEVSGKIYKLSDANIEFNKNPTQTMAQVQTDIKNNMLPISDTPAANTTTTTAITISSIDNITAVVNQNASYSLPNIVQATMSDKSTKSVPVTWDKQVDTSQAGTFIFNGTVNGYSDNVVLILAVNATSSSVQKLNYVSLGDSLASGETPYGVKSGYGYTDVIAGDLASEGVLGNYSKYGVSGYTTSDVLNQLQDTNVIASIHNSQIVTIDIGADDLLSLLKGYLTGENVDLITQIGVTTQNIKKIIQSIQTINPSAKIYIMGYYNALPNLTSQQETEFLPFLSAFNNYVKSVVSGFNNTTTLPVYVDTYDSMNNNLQQYLPGDIHPTVDGYKVIGQDFWNLIKADFSSELK